MPSKPPQTIRSRKPAGHKPQVVLPTAGNVTHHVAWGHYVKRGNVIRIALCDSDTPGAFPMYRFKHNDECATDEHARTVCEGMYEDKCDEVIELCTTLKAIRTISMDAEILELIEEALEKHE